MKVNGSKTGLVLIGIVFVSFAGVSAKAASFQGLGDLPGGGGMVGLGDLPAGHSLEEMPQYKDTFLLSDKAVIVLHHLHKELGEDVLLSAVSKFLDAHRTKPSTFKDFEKAVSKQTGRSLRPFFHRWFETTEPLPQEWKKQDTASPASRDTQPTNHPSQSVVSTAQRPAMIDTLDDLKAAINSPSSFEVIRDMDSWLPALVSSFPWETRMSRHYVLHYYIDARDEDDVLFDSFLTESEKIYDQLEKFFHIEAKSKQEIMALLTKLSCFIVKTRTKKTFGSLTNPHVLFYLMDTKQDPDYMQRFRHEYAHWVWFRMYGAAPSLFQEGVAVYAEKMSKPEADISAFLDIRLDLQNIPPLYEIAINENFWKYKQADMYTAGGFLIHFLVEKWGWEPLKRLFLLSDFDDPDINEHFTQVYGCSLKAVDTEWRQFLRSKAIAK